MTTACVLCDTTGGELFWQDDFCRVVLIRSTDFPGFCRVILKDHVKEMTDLLEPEQQRLMHIVFKVEQAVRKVLNPEKVNLASLGNKTPHIHWHITPRYEDDATFPDSIWSNTIRPAQTDLNASSTAELKAEIQRLLS